MSMDFKREDDSENPWRIDSARYKFAPYLLVHCRRTEILSSSTLTTTTMLWTGFSAGEYIGAWSITQKDPYFSNVSFLLHFDGSLSSSVFTDSGPIGAVVTTTGNVFVNTATKKFGTGSGDFDGASDYLSIPDHSSVNVGASNFTIEGFFNTDTVAAGFGTIITKRTSNTPYAPFHVRRNGSLVGLSISNEAGTNYKVSIETGSITSSAYYHFALVRNGTDVALYIEGTRLISASLSISYSILGNTSAVIIGGDTNTNYWNGTIDEVRFTKGIARYTGNFTPPTQAFPNS